MNEELLKKAWMHTRNAEINSVDAVRLHDIFIDEILPARIAYLGNPTDSLLDGIAIGIRMGREYARLEREES